MISEPSENSQELDNSKAPDDLIDRLLDEWEAACDRGVVLSSSQLCRDCPEAIPVIEEKLKQLRRANDFLEQPTNLAHTTPAPPSENMEDVELTTRLTNLNLVSSGGLGEVYEATDIRLGRTVAVKFLKQDHVDTELAVKQFVEEARITALLDHPGVVPIYARDRNASTGQPFYAMRYLEQGTLDEAVNEYYRHQPQDRGERARHDIHFRRLLNSFMSAARTIEYAHSRGVLHLDIKPKNILIGRFGETLVSDWGSALITGRDSHYSGDVEGTLPRSEDPPVPERLSSDPGGTVPYMSPERLLCTDDPSLGPAADVYSLGVTLYFILTGQSPFQGMRRFSQIREAAVAADYPKPRTVRKQVHRSLEAICLKAMHQSHRERYLTAADLARDVERYLADEPTEAMHETMGHRVSRWMRHHYGLMRTAGAACVVLAVLSSLFAWRSVEQAEAESTARQSAEAAVLAASVARDESMEFATRMTAQTIALKQNDRFRILEMETSRPAFLKLMKAANQEGESISAETLDRLDAYFRDRVARHRAANALSWFICRADGLQVGRFPYKETVGQNNYAYRDYFHGLGSDEPTDTIRYIRQPNLSKVYRSSNTSELKVALSAPIWDDTDGRQFLGVLGLSIGVNEFGELKEQLSGNHRVSVIDLRPNEIDEVSAGRGWILHHSDAVHSPKIHKVDQELVTAVDKLFQKTERQWNKEQRLRRTPLHMIEKFSDPVTGRVGPALFAPVFLEGREWTLANTQWGVVLIDSSESAEKSRAAIDID
ncbi:protein kinase domain-containing protein [Stratiformator vulcanicus]|uniref:Serine/threonine-protein kinase PknD n=1 Tax=Stratiformator vulcanicus TaxID=2527980 RepID=A0A517R4F2_9PLAN|nr:protein kinase [Stratiformator vulcanicus]QDT38730.1 Serine/threonine-protein kinase PknD [Stratiformator vulcanicus]